MKKIEILNISRNLINSVAFYGKFATIWWEKFRHLNNRCLRELNWQTSGKKKRAYLGGRSCFPYMAQNKWYWRENFRQIILGKVIFNNKADHYYLHFSIYSPYQYQVFDEKCKIADSTIRKASSKNKFVHWDLDIRKSHDSFGVKSVLITRSKSFSWHFWQLKPIGFTMQGSKPTTIQMKNLLQV